MSHGRDVSGGLASFRTEVVTLAHVQLGRDPDRDGPERTSERAIRLLPITKDALDGTDVLYYAAEVCAMSRDLDCAVRHLDALLSQPSWVTPHWLQLDPIWNPLRDHPRFQALLEKYE